jgi:PAS domain S-box-containing protein
MADSIRRMLWGAFFTLAVLVAIALGLTLVILNLEKKQETRVLQSAKPLVDAVREMDADTLIVVSSARGYVLTHQTLFEQQQADAIRAFDKAAATATQLATDPSDARAVNAFRKYFADVRGLSERQIALAKQGNNDNAVEFLLETARVMRSAPDYAGTIADYHARQQTRELQSMAAVRQWLILGMVIASVLLVTIAAFAVSRIEQSLTGSIARQIRRTEAIIAGMADGVMLVDSEGRTVFVNPAGQKLFGTSQLDVPIFKHGDLYRLRNEAGRAMNPDELPAAQALATGRSIQDETMFIDRGDRRIAISMSATPLTEEGRISGAIVTFRNITERRNLEEETQRQAENAQILADAGAFFASNIDPVWVTQAVAERSAEVLGDWAAVILKSSESNELRVAAIHHRDMASLGLAWSYIYRQPLVAGEGIIGQVVATGYPSLTVDPGSTAAANTNTTSYHSPSMKLASLLILPLRTRREMLGALVIAANDPARSMNDEKLPLAEELASRAALAIDNAKLYTVQVEARRKVEDLSRLKDEFLSIASHELRTPVTSIKGYTQLAKTLIREDDLPTAEEYLDVALDQIDRMSRLILELLDVSRIETGRLEIRREPIEWITFVKNLVQRHHTAVSDRRFHVSLPDSKSQIVGDRDRLEQVLGNLLENAVKYSPDGSEIFVTVEDRGDAVVTAVADRGMGIPPDELNQVFERFHRGRQVSSTNYGGLGLGLYITKQIVERHGGSIWVESKEGQGTTFYFSIPAAPVENPAQRIETPAAARS